MLHLLPELRSCEKVEVAVQGSPSPVIHNYGLNGELGNGELERQDFLPI